MIEKSLLIIDDERRMADSLRDLLGAAGYGAETAYSGAEGIEALRQRPYSVVVTDLRMQGVDGIDVIRHISVHAPRTQVIIVTGYASTETAIEAVRCHVFDYLRKPFEFDDLKKAVDRALDKLEVEQLREDTAAMITHDIKAPLASMVGFAAMLHDRKTGRPHEKAAEYAQTIHASGQRVLALIDNFLTTCKLDAGTLAPHPTRTLPGGLAEDLLEIYAPEAERLGMRLEADVSEAPNEAWLDEGLVFRALGNLLQNAIKYGDPSEPIRLRIAKVGAAESPLGIESVVFETTNRSASPLPPDLSELFQRFTRASITSGIAGSGIGLYVVDVVAKAHGGVAQAEALEGERARFSITMPIDPQGDLKGSTPLGVVRSRRS